jgi:hypothetical protein
MTLIGSTTAFGSSERFSGFFSSAAQPRWRPLFCAWSSSELSARAFRWLRQQQRRRAPALARPAFLRPPQVRPPPERLELRLVFLRSQQLLLRSLLLPWVFLVRPFVVN